MQYIMIIQIETRELASTGNSKEIGLIIEAKHY